MRQLRAVVTAAVRAWLRQPLERIPGAVRASGPLRSRFRTWLRRRQPDPWAGSIITPRTAPIISGAMALSVRQLTPKELREPSARWMEREESWLRRRRGERGYDLSGFTKGGRW